MNEMNLWDAEPGKKYKVVELDTGLFSNLDDLGLEAGKTLEKLKLIEFDKVVRIAMNGDTTVLSDDEAKNVIVESID